VQISPKELRRMAGDIDDMHRDSMRTFADEVGGLHIGEELRAGRRSFLKKAAVGGAAITFGSTIVPISSLLPAAGAQEVSGDVAIAQFAESVELAAIEAYKAGIPLLSPEVVPVAELFLSHHQEHAEAFASLAGDAATGAPNQALLDHLAPTLAELGDQTAVLTFAKELEDQAAVTYAFALTGLESPEAAAGTATILPVETAHSAALAVALGLGPEEQFPFGAFTSADIANGVNPQTFPVA
jgi:hypothetical protein